MNIFDISSMPTSITINNPGSYHESIFRSYHVLNRVKEYLEKEVPYDVILELIEVMETPKIVEEKQVMINQTIINNAGG